MILVILRIMPYCDTSCRSMMRHDAIQCGTIRHDNHVLRYAAPNHATPRLATHAYNMYVCMYVCM